MLVSFLTRYNRLVSASNGESLVRAGLRSGQCRNGLLPSAHSLTDNVTDKCKWSNRRVALALIPILGNLITIGRPDVFQKCTKQCTASRIGRERILMVGQSDHEDAHEITLCESLIARSFQVSNQIASLLGLRHMEIHIVHRHYHLRVRQPLVQ